MNSSSNSERARRLSKIEEDSVWEKSVDSPDSDIEEICSPGSNGTPERAKQKIKFLEEIVTNVQLDFDTLKEYTTLERQLLSYEKSRDPSHPDILSSLLNISKMDQSQRILEDPEISLSSMDESCINSLPNETSDHCVQDFQNTISNLTKENFELQQLLNNKENYIKKLLEKQTVDCRFLSELKLQNEESTVSNEKYEKNINSLTVSNQVFEKTCDNGTGENVNIVNMQDQINILREENMHLKEEVESLRRFKLMHEEQELSLTKTKEDQNSLAETTKILQNQINALQKEVDCLHVYKVQIDEQNQILNRLKEEFSLPKNSKHSVLSDLEEYVLNLRKEFENLQNLTKKHDQQENFTDQENLKQKKILQEKVTNVEEQFENSGKVASTMNPCQLIGSNDNNSSLFALGEKEAIIQTTHAEIESLKSELLTQKSNLEELERTIELKNKDIEQLTADLNSNNTLKNKLNLKVNIMSSFIDFQIKNLEKLSNNNNSLCFIIKEKDRCLKQLNMRLTGLKSKVKEFKEEKDKESSKFNDVSNYFHGLFDSSFYETFIEPLVGSIDETNDSFNNASNNFNGHPDSSKVIDVSCVLNEDESMIENLSVSQSFIDFSKCLNVLLITLDQVEKSCDENWLNSTSNYFHKLFDSSSLLDLTVDDSKCKNSSLSFNDASFSLKHLFTSVNGSGIMERSSNANKNNDEVSMEQSFNDSSRLLYNLFDSNVMNNSKINHSQNESILNVSNFFNNLSKSESSSIHNFNFSGISNNQSLSYDVECKGNESQSSAISSMNLQNLFNLSANCSKSFSSEQPGESSNKMNESKSDFSESMLPEIALCNGTINSTIMFNGDTLCSEDPLKSFCLDKTVVSIDPLASNSSHYNAPVEDNDSDSSFNVSRTIVNLKSKFESLKSLLDQFVKDFESLSDNINASVNGSIYDVSNSLLEEYQLTLKNLNLLFEKTCKRVKYVPGVCESNVILSEAFVKVDQTTGEISELKAVTQPSNEENLTLTLDSQIMSEVNDLTDNKEIIDPKQFEMKETKEQLILSQAEMDKEHAENKIFNLTLEQEKTDPTTAGLKEEVEALEHQVKLKNAEIVRLSTELEKIHHQKQELQGMFDSLSLQSVANEKICGDQMVKLRQIEDENQSKEKTIMNLVREIQNKEEESKVKSSEIENLSLQLTDDQEKVCKIVKLHQNFGNHLDDSVNCSSPIIALNEVIKNVLNDNKYLEEQLMSFIEEIVDFKTQLEHKNIEIENLGKFESENKIMFETTVCDLKSQLLSLKAKNDCVIEQLATVEGALNTKTVEMNLKTSELKDLMDKISALKDNTSYLETMEETLKSNELTISDLKSKLSASIENEKCLKKKLESETERFENQLQEKALNIEQLSEDLENSCSKVDFELLQTKLAEIEEKLEGEQGLANELQQTVNDLEQDKKHLEEELMKFMENSDNLAAQLEGKNLELNELKRETSMLIELKQELIELTEALKAKDEQINVLTCQLNHLQAKSKEEYLIEMNSKNKLLEEKDALTAEYEEKIRQIENDKLSLSEKLEQQSKIISDLEENMQHLNTLKENLVELSNDNISKETRINDLIKELNVLKEEKSKAEATAEFSELAQAKLSETEKELEEKDALIKELQKTQEGFIESKKLFEENIAQLICENNSLKVDLECKLNEKEALVKELQEELDNLKEDKTYFENKMMELMEEEDKLKLALENFDNDKTHFEEKITQLIRERDGLKEDFVFKLNEKDSLLTELQEELKNFKEDKAYFEDKILELMQEEDKLKLALENLDSDKTHVETKVEQLICEKNNVKGDLELKLKEKEALLVELAERLKDLEEDKKYLEDNMMLLMEEKDNLTLIVENFHNDKTHFEDKISQLALDEGEIKEKLECKLKEKEILVSELQEKLNSLENDKKYLEGKMMLLMDEESKLKSTLKCKDAEVEDLLAKDVISKQSLDKLNEEKVCKEKYVSELLAKLKELEQMVEPKDSNHDDHAAMETELKSKDEALTHLKIKINDLEKNKQHKETEVCLLLKKLDDYQAKVETQLNEIDRLSKHSLEAEHQILQNELNKLQSIVESDKITIQDLSKKLSEEKTIKAAGDTELVLTLAGVKENLILKSAEVEKLLKELALLSEDNETIKNLLSDKNVELKLKNEAVDSIQNKFNALKSETSCKISELTETIDRLNELLAEKSNRVLDLEKKVAEESFAVSEMHNKLRLDEEAISNLTLELENLKALVNGKSDRIAELDAQIADLVSQLESKSTEINDLKVTPDYKDENLSDLRAQLKLKEITVSELNQKLVALEADNLAKTNEIAKLLQDLDAKSIELKNISAQLFNADERIHELKSMEEELKKFKVVVKTNEDLVAVLQEKMNSHEQEKQSNEAEKSALLKKLSEIHELVDSKTSEVNALNDQLIKINITKDAVIKELQSKITNSEMESNDLNILAEARDAKQLIVKEIKFLKAETQTENASLSVLIQNLMALIMEKQQEVFSQLSNETVVLKKEVKFLKTNENERKKWLSELETENSKLMAQYDGQVSEITALNHKLSSMNEELIEKTEFVKELQTKCEAKQTEIVELNVQLEDLRVPFADKQSDTNLIEKIEEVNVLSNECDKLRCQLVKEENEVSDLKSLIQKEHAEVIELTNNCTQLKNKLDEVLLLNESLQSKLICKDDEIYQLKESLDKSSNLVEVINNLKCKYEEAVIAKENISADLEIYKQSSDEKSKNIELLESKIKENTIENDRLKESLAEKTVQITNLTETVSEQSQKIEDLNKTLTENTNKISSLNDTLKEKTLEIESLQKNLDQKSLQIITLTKVVDEKTANLVKQQELLASKISLEENDVSSTKTPENAVEKIEQLSQEVKLLKETARKNKSAIEELVLVKSESKKLKEQVESLTENAKFLESKLLVEKNRVTIMVSEIKSLEVEKRKLEENLKTVETEKARLEENLKQLDCSKSDSCAFTSPLNQSKEVDKSPNSLMLKRNMMKCEKLTRKNAALEKKIDDLMEKEEILEEIEKNLRAVLRNENPTSCVLTLISCVEKKLESADESLKKLSKELAEKNQMLVLKSEEYSVSKQSFEKTIQTLKTAVDQNVEKINSLKDQLYQTEQEKKTLDEECVLTWQQCTALEKDYADALRRESELKQRLHQTTAVSEACVVTEDDFLNLKSEKEALMQDNLDLASQLRNLKIEKKQMVADFYKTKAKFKELDVEVNTLKRKIKILEEEKSVLETKNQNSVKKLVEVTNEKENLSSNLDLMLAKYDALLTAKKSSDEDQVNHLKSQIQHCRQEIVEKNSKITMLELQIQSENFPHRNKAIELESVVANYKHKVEDLRSQLRRYQASLQESTIQTMPECRLCCSRRNKKLSTIGTQTSSTLTLDGEKTSIVEANSEALLKDRVKKLERGHETLKRLCRLRAQKISDLENVLKQHNLPIPEAKENPPTAQAKSVVKPAEKESSFASRLWPF